LRQDCTTHLNNSIFACTQKVGSQP